MGQYDHASTDFITVLDLDPEALAWFVDAPTQAELWQAAAEFPFTTDVAFMAKIEQVVATGVTLDQRPLFEQRLQWLRQMAFERK